MFINDLFIRFICNLFIYLIGVLRRIQEYFTFTIMVGGKQTVSERNPWLSAGC